MTPEIARYSTMTPEIAALAVLILLPLLLRFIGNAISKKKHLPPSPLKLPFIGNIHQMGILPHRSLHSLSQKHGPIMFLQLGSVPTVIISSAEYAREIMKTYDHIFASRPSVKAARILFNDGMDVAFGNGDRWKNARKICINNLLSYKLVQSFNQIREEEVASLIAQISASSIAGEMVNMSELLNTFTNKISCRTILGNSSKEGMNKLLCEIVAEDSDLMEKFYVEDYFPFLGWLDEISGIGAQTRRLAKRWYDFLDEVIAEKDAKNEDDGSFLGVLLSLQKDQSKDSNISRELIKILAHQLLIGGTDTSFIAFEWGMTELIRNPKAAEKLTDEIREIARGKQMVQEEDLSKMRYLKAVIKEIMRLHPPLPLLVPRIATQDCQVLGYDIPKGTKVIINAWSVSRNPMSWEEPEEFRPERFLDSTVDFGGHDFQLIPFGSGRRICPGIQFSVPGLELAFANLVHQFDWELPTGMKVEDLSMEEVPGITVRRKVGLRLTPKKVSNI